MRSGVEGLYFDPRYEYADIGYAIYSVESQVKILTVDDKAPADLISEYWPRKAHQRITSTNNPLEFNHSILGG